MAVLPTRILEIEFDAGVWTDVTADFVGLATKRGRNKESGAFETGQLIFTLRNDGRKYDPDNAAGPYYGKLRPNRRVRYRATYAAVTYPVFLGYIDDIAQVYGGPNDATAVFTVSDFFKLLNRAELPVSVYATEVAADNPALWWRLDEPAGSTTAYDATANRRNGTLVGDPAMIPGASTLIVRDPGSAYEMVNAQAGGIEGLYTLTEAAWTIECWLNVSTLTALPMLFYAIPPPFSGASEISIQGNMATMAFNIINSAGTLYTMNVATPTATGRTYHLAFVHGADRVMRVYVDGALDATGPTTTGTWTARQFYLGGWPGARFPYVGTVDEFAIYPTALSAARLAAHNAAGRTPWNGELPGTRLGRIFDLAAVPALDRNIDAGTTTLQATDLGGTVLGYAQKVEETELGWLFVARDGKLRFIGREAGVTGAYLTSLATLVDADSGAGLPYRFSSSDAGESTMVTRATVSREGSVAVTFYDASAKAEFGWLDETHEGLLHNSDAYSQAYAEWIVNTHKTPTSRVGTVELELTGDPANLYPAILALEIGDRVTYKKKPQNVGAVIDLAMRVEAISHETGGHYWRTRLQLSPFNLAGGNPVLVWDTGRWDQSVWGI